MKVILLKRCRWGRIGDLITVKPGFARNYLIPRSIAQRATPDNLCEFERRKHELEMVERQLLTSAEMIRDSLGYASITLVREASRDMKLYGAVSQRDIAQAIYENYGVEISPHNIYIPRKLKDVGLVKDIQIKLHHDVVVPLELNILPQESK
jgi:large subunit ribosomal protein L9